MSAALRLGVTGARGFIGSRLVQMALDAGFEVRTFCRATWTGPPYVPRRNRYQLVLPDAPDRSALEGLDAIIHLAVAPHGSTEETSVAVNVVGTVRLQEAAAAAGVGRFIFVSTQSAHDGARNRYGRTKRAAELALAERSGVVVVRPGLVYDGGDRGLLARSASAAAKLRVFPVVGGDRSVAQTIFLDDLVSALLRFADPYEEPEPPPLIELAEPVVRPIGQLVAEAAQARYGRRPRLINIPLEAAVKGARIGSLLPMGEAVSEVVDGIVGFRPMDTGPALRELGINLRPFDASVFRPRVTGESRELGRSEAPSDDAVRGEDALRLALVGSGRIGTAHALCGSQHPDAVLCALVDPRKMATSQVQSVLGLSAPRYDSVEELLASADRPDVAIVATPPGTHADIATRLLDADIGVLVEKPLAPQAQRGALLSSARRAAERGLTSGTGYHMLQLPFLRSTRDRFMAGDFGTPLRFCALSFVTRADSGRGLSWELDRAAAGGGVLSHVPAHALSILDMFLGPLDAIESTLVHVAGRDVEDAAWVHLGNGTVDGSLFTGWHLADFVHPENSVRIETDRGLLVLTSASAAFFPADGAEPEIVTPLDHPAPGFDPTPLEAGLGFWLEQRGLLEGVQEVNSFFVADRIERVVDQAYAKATTGALATDAAGTGDVDDRRTADGEVAEHQADRCYIDLRRLSADDLGQLPRYCYVAGPEYLPLLGGTDPIIVLPEVPKIFRAATNDGLAAVVRRFGFANLLKAGSLVNPVRVLSTQARFWEAITVLLRADLGLMDRDHRGRVALDGYLVDLAAAGGRFDELVRLLHVLRQRLPSAEIGVESNAPDLLCRVLPVIASQVSFVLSVGSPASGLAQRLREAAGDPHLTVMVKTGPQPPEVVAVAANDPSSWIGEGDALVLDGRGSPTFSWLNASIMRRAVASTGCPEWAAMDAGELLQL